MCLLTLGEMIWKIPYPDFAVFYIDVAKSFSWTDWVMILMIPSSQYTLVDSEINES